VSASLPITILIEGLVVLGYAHWHKKPAGRLLLASLIINVATQIALWLLLELFSGHYLATLLIAEALIWPVEGLWLYAFPGSSLTMQQALLLSLAMNTASFGLGWLLPF